MLEKIAFQYATAEGDTVLIAYAMTIAGGLISTLTRHRSVALARAPYFAIVALLFFIKTALQFVWLGSGAAVEAGFLWIFFLSDLIGSFCVGFALAVAARARSRDIHGHGRMAALAFIPIANFWLLLAASDSKLETKCGAPGFLRPIFSLIAGAMLLLFGVLLALVTQLVAIESPIAADAGSVSARTEIENSLRAKGLEATLHDLAQSVPSHRVDESTMFIRLEASGTKISYIYELSAGLPPLTPDFQANLTQQNCSNEGTRALLQAGATIEHIYFRPDEDFIDLIVIEQSACAF